jgi:hypothetical protein
LAADHEITIDPTVPVSVRPAIEGLVARLLPTYPHVRKVHVALDDRSWIVTAWDGTGTAVVDRELIEAIRRALSTAEAH